MSVEHVINVVKIADYDNLPALEYRNKALKQEVNSLEIKKLNSKRSLQDLKNQILNLRKALDSCDLTYTQQVEKIAELQSKRIGLEDLVRRFENNDEEYLKIKQTVKQEVSSILSDGKVLLRLALLSLSESIRNNPEKYSSLIYYNGIYGQQQQYSLSQNYYNEHYTATLVQEAEKLYDKLVTDLANRVIDDAAFSSSTLSSSPALSQSADVQQPSSSPRR